MCLTIVTTSAPDSFRAGRRASALSASWVPRSSSIAPRGVSLSIRYAAVFCQASACASSPENSK